MSRFVFLTKTRWDEPPRIRHQLARLLSEAGHEVVFFEKPEPVWRSLPAPRERGAHLRLARHHELVHHKLRLIAPADHLNAWATTRSLRQALRRAGVTPDAVVVNFNYDYWFLRRVFPTQRLITMINDDFTSSALFGYSGPLRHALARTCRASDRVLTVSRPLQRDLAAFCQAELFLPWADREYAAPASSTRDLLLFWGYINRRFDFPLVESLARELATARPQLRLLIVGPVEQGAGETLSRLQGLGNVDVRPASSLDDLPVERVLASLIPYRADSAENDACELPNKALQLLARGLPLLISGMPHFIDEPFVFRVGKMPIAAQVDELRSRFDDLQPAIQRLVATHSRAARLEQFMRLAA